MHQFPLIPLLLFALCGPTVSCASSHRVSASTPPKREALPSSAQPKALSQEYDEAIAQSLLRRARSTQGKGGPLGASESAIALSTKGLALAPPQGKASSSTVVELLITRAQSLMVQRQFDAAHRDLSAAKLWSARLETDSSLASVRIQLLEADIYFAQGDWRSSAQHAISARKSANRHGSLGALLECESIVRLVRIGRKAASSGDENLTVADPKEVYEVLQRNGYPEHLQAMAFTTLPLLGPVTAAEIRRLVGPMPISYFDSQGRDEDFITQALAERSDKPAAKPRPKSTSSRQTSEIAPKIRDCYQQELNDDPGSYGNALFALEIDSSGSVAGVSARFFHLTPRAERCLTMTMLNARFAPSERSLTVIFIPITLMKQD